MNGITVDGVHYEIDEFSEEQVSNICDIIDNMACIDKELYQCTLDAEGDDNMEYLCDLIDNWYKHDIVIDTQKFVF